MTTETNETEIEIIASGDNYDGNERGYHCYPHVPILYSGVFQGPAGDDRPRTEVRQSACLGDLVISTDLHDDTPTRIYEIVEILSKPYEAERPYTPAPAVVLVALRPIHTVVPKAGRRSATHRAAERAGF